MKRFLTNLILVISILSILVIPSFAATASDSDEIVILKQPVDQYLHLDPDNKYSFSLSIVAIGTDLQYQWQYSEDLKTWNILSHLSDSPDFSGRFPASFPDRYIRCKIVSGNQVVYSRIALLEKSPANIFNFIGSCLRYITSYISLIVNSLVTPGAPFFALLPILCIGIGVAALLIVIKIIKSFSWGM